MQVPPCAGGSGACGAGVDIGTCGRLGAVGGRSGAPAVEHLFVSRWRKAGAVSPKSWNFGNVLTSRHIRISVCVVDVR